MAWLLEAIREELDVWGYRGQHIILKCDQEPRIEAVRKAVSEPRGANGRAEDAGRRIREYLITLKDQLENKMDADIPTGAEILQWMIRWAAMAISRCAVGRDGKTAYERMRG